MIFANGKAHQHADRRRKRNGDQQAREAEQIAEGEQRKHQPDRMQADLGADEVGRQDVAFEPLAEHKHQRPPADRNPVRPELRHRDDGGDEKSAERADERNEAEQAGHQADQKSRLEPDERQADGVEDRKDQADHRLPAHEAGDGAVHVAGEPVHRVAMMPRNPAVDRLHHAVPVDQQIERHDRRDDEKRQHREHGAPARPQRRQECRDEAQALRHRPAGLCAGGGHPPPKILASQGLLGSDRIDCTLAI